MLCVPNTALPSQNGVGTNPTAAAKPERAVNGDTTEGTIARAKTRDSSQNTRNWDAAQGMGKSRGMERNGQIEHGKVPFEDDPDVPPLI